MPRKDAKLIAKWLGQDFFSKKDSTMSYGDIFTSWKAWVLMLNYVSSFGGYLAIGNFLPNHLMEYHKLNDTQNLLIDAVFMTTVCGMRVLWGPMTDKLSGSTSTIVS